MESRTNAYVSCPPVDPPDLKPTCTSQTAVSGSSRTRTFSATNCSKMNKYQEVYKHLQNDAYVTGNSLLETNYRLRQAIEECRKRSGGSCNLPTLGEIPNITGVPRDPPMENILDSYNYMNKVGASVLAYNRYLEAQNKVLSAQYQQMQGAMGTPSPAPASSSAAAWWQ